MKKEFFYFLLIVLSAISCNRKDNLAHSITIKNTLDVARAFETVELPKTDLLLNEGEDFEKFIIRDSETKTALISQFVDTNQDGMFDVLLFQPEIGPKEDKEFELVQLEENPKQDAINYCYSRFVPERTDDYAWENDKVAFRTYGPVGQQMVEQNIDGGTLTSGIDGWLKKVDYPIINDWYKKTVNGAGSYHKDTGEGLDNFHVGKSRGIGGVAVKVDSIYYVSKNFIDWKTITTGPIRTSFTLKYDDWDAAGNLISEEKHISLDYGSHLSHYEVSVIGPDVLSVGLTLHENDGVIKTQVDKGWISYWEPHGDSELGTAVLTSKNTMVDVENYKNDNISELSNLYAHLKINNNKVIYYTGFAWKESGHIETQAAWETYLNDFSNKINNPLKVLIK